MVIAVSPAVCVPTAAEAFSLTSQVGVLTDGFDGFKEDACGLGWRDERRDKCVCIVTRSTLWDQSVLCLSAFLSEVKVISISISISIRYRARSVSFNARNLFSLLRQIRK